MSNRKKRAFFRNRGHVPHQAARPMSMAVRQAIAEMHRLGIFYLPTLRRGRARRG